MANSIFDIFRIDRLGKGIFSKIIFTIGLLAGVSVYFCPLGDTDFSRFLAWSEAAFENMELFMTTSPADLPLTLGNYIFMLHIMGSYFVTLLCGIVYCGVYIRQYRLEHKKEDPGDSGYLIPPRFLTPLASWKLVLRMVIVFCFSLIIFIPATFSVLYLFLIFIIILPYIGMYPACYLSGDTGFFGSFAEMIKVTKGYYLVNARNMSLIVSLLFVGRWLTSVLMSTVPTAAYVIGPLVDIFLVLSFGRYVGKVYCRMREIPGGFKIGN